MDDKEKMFLMQCDFFVIQEMFLSRNYIKSMHLCIVGNTKFGKTIPLRVNNFFWRESECVQVQ